MTRLTAERRAEIDEHLADGDHGAAECIIADLLAEIDALRAERDRARETIATSLEALRADRDKLARERDAALAALDDG